MSRRGLSMLELMLALTITAMVAAAIAGMISVVTVGVDMRRDTRTIMVRGATTQSRLSAYIAPSRCFLAKDSTGFVIWLNDTRQSDTIHATEVRWLAYDADQRTLVARYVEFPSEWSQAACDMADLEYPVTSNWAKVLEAYQAAGHVGAMTLIDELDGGAVALDQTDPLDARYVKLDLTFTATDGEPVDLTVASAIRLHLQPTS